MSVGISDLAIHRVRMHGSMVPHCIAGVSQREISEHFPGLAMPIAMSDLAIHSAPSAWLDGATLHCRGLSEGDH